MKILALMVTFLAPCASFVKIDGDFVTWLLKLPVLKIISRVVLSPTASASFSKGAWVQPQPGLTLMILSVSVPAE